MPCPKCGHMLITEDGVVYCEECLYVVERKDDPKYDLISETSREVAPKKRGRPKKITLVEKPPADKKQSAKGKTCSEEGCNAPVLAKGLCKTCYKRKWEREKHNTRPIDYRGRYFVSRTCKEEGCNKKHYAKGYCKKHYVLHQKQVSKYYRYAKPGERRCALCLRLHYARGLCKKHYQKVYRYGVAWKAALKDGYIAKNKSVTHLKDLAADSHDIYKTYCEAGGMQKAADELGVSRSTLLVWLKRNGYPLIHRKGRESLSPQTITEIKKLRLQGFMILTICKRLGISHTTVKKYQPNVTRGVRGNK